MGNLRFPCGHVSQQYESAPLLFFSRGNHQWITNSPKHLLINWGRCLVCYWLYMSYFQDPIITMAMLILSLVHCAVFALSGAARSSHSKPRKHLILVWHLKWYSSHYILGKWHFFIVVTSLFREDTNVMETHMEQSPPAGKCSMLLHPSSSMNKQLVAFRSAELQHRDGWNLVHEEIRFPSST